MHWVACNFASCWPVPTKELCWAESFTNTVLRDRFKRQTFHSKNVNSFAGTLLCFFEALQPHAKELKQQKKIGIFKNIARKTGKGKIRAGASLGFSRMVSVACSAAMGPALQQHALVLLTSCLMLPDLHRAGVWGIKTWESRDALWVVTCGFMVALHAFLEGGGSGAAASPQHDVCRTFTGWEPPQKADSAGWPKRCYQGFTKTMLLCCTEAFGPALHAARVYYCLHTLLVSCYLMMHAATLTWSPFGKAPGPHQVQSNDMLPCSPQPAGCLEALHWYFGDSWSANKLEKGLFF